MSVEKIDGMSMDVEQSDRDKLRTLFPQCFAEGRLDIDKLLTMCGEYIDDDFEKYEFKWKGKRDCLKLAQMRSTAALRPCEGESVNFDTTKNLYIEGDNLEVLKLLQKAYFRRVKMIYIDPPYNTGNDFVYEDDFSETLVRYREVTSQATKSNPETMGRFHTNWLNMIYPRLRLAANLLRDDGVIFISIDDGEMHNLRKICDEVFGEENFQACISWQKRYTRSNNTVEFTTVVEYLLVYAKTSEFSVNLLERTDEADGRYTNPDNDPRGPWKGASFLNPATPIQRPNLCYPIQNPNTGEVTHPTTNAWRRSESVFQELKNDNRLYWGSDGTAKIPSIKMFLSDARGLTPINFWAHDYAGNTDQGTLELAELLNGKYFNNPKPSLLIKRIIEHATSTDSLILDFFSGSSTTAHAVMQQNAEDGGNRQFIMVQLPELVPEKSEAYAAGFKNICEIGKERIRRAGAQLLETSAQGTLGQTPHPLDIGFKVFKLDSSNLKTWDSSHISAEQQAKLGKRLNTMIERVKPDRTDLDMVYEVMLKLGVPLDFPVTKLDVNGTPAYSVGEDSLLLVCLAPALDVETLEQLADHAPAKMILAETSFADDSAMSNAYYTLRDKGIEFKFI